MDNVKTNESTLKTISLDGVELTPIKPLFTQEQTEKLMKELNSPES